jgi:hypothetical protein
MKRILLLTLIYSSLVGEAQAYSSTELLEDCLAAEEFYTQKKGNNPYQSIRGARCMAYIAGFADGFGVGDYLADKVGVRLNAICLPPDNDLPYRLVRSVLAHLEHQPPNNGASTATLVAGALSKSFPCAEVVEKNDTQTSISKPFSLHRSSTD